MDVTTTGTAAAPPVVLPQREWHARRDAHRTRIDRLLAGHRARRREGAEHPVEDFLFSYYSYRPPALRRWHPGPGVLLEADTQPELSRGYRAGPRGLGLDPEYVASRWDTVRWIRDLLDATSRRRPSYGCLGLHEWAMVYRQTPDDIRHPSWPLRLGSAGTDAVVESHRLACTHFDAFRFFTVPARPRNALRPSRELQQDMEQPGCLHAGMDLYKWAYKLAPMSPSELVADCFELARDIRVLDMRASPYDLRALGYRPVRIETAAGKQEYADGQRDFAARAAPLRHRLLDVCDQLLNGVV